MSTRIIPADTLPTGEVGESIPGEYRILIGRGLEEEPGSGVVCPGFPASPTGSEMVLFLAKLSLSLYCLPEGGCGAPRGLDPLKINQITNLYETLFYNPRETSGISAKIMI